MEVVYGHGTDVPAYVSQPQSTADNLLLRQLTEAHLQLREQERTTNQALVDKQNLEDRVTKLELNFGHKDRGLVTAERVRDMEVPGISDVLEKTRHGLEEANIVIDKLLQEKAPRMEGRILSQARLASAVRSATCSRRPYVCVIIDGDANHFLPELLRAGGHGGEAAAERLKHEVFQFITERTYIPRSCTIKVQVFMNRSGFVNTVYSLDHTPKELINSCLDRFFQSQPMWDLVDTGGRQESADTKIKANFKFFVDDSDCFAMIMGVCSDNGYVQLLQEFQGDPETMSKVVLLTSCNTIINIQCLAYAIVRWPTVFRSTQISNRDSYGLAGPATKGVTPLEDFVLSANRSVPVANEGKLIEPPSSPELRNVSRARLPSVSDRLSVLPSGSSVIPVSFSRIAVSQVPHEQQRQKRQRPGRQKRHERNTKNEYCLDVATRRGSQQPPAEATELCLPAQSRNDSLEDPDCQLAHAFNVPKVPVQRVDANSSCFRRSLFTSANGVLPCTGSAMRTIVAGIRIPPALRLLTSNNPKPPRNPAGAVCGTTIVYTHAGSQSPTTTPPLNNALWQPKEDPPFPGTSTAPASEHAPSALKDPFVHVPMPNRAQEARYDPDRFLYQQSPHYIASTHQYLQAIVSHVRRNYHTTTKAVRRQVRPLIEIAEFILSRLWLAQEVQKLEDQAMERQIRCSQPSTFRCDDAWGNDWYLYCSMSRALGHKIKPALTRQCNSIAKSGLAKMDWAVLVDGSAWKASASNDAAVPRRRALNEG